jgi:hypothetical protein
MNKLIIFLLFFVANTIQAEEAKPVKMNDQCGDQSHLPKEQRLFNKIKWKTASEQDNFGYEIFRSDTEDGEYVVVTEEMMEGAGTTSDESYYEFRDDTIDPCKRYYYYVESISTDGVREAFTPKFRSKYKIQPEDQG